MTLLLAVALCAATAATPAKAPQGQAPVYTGTKLEQGQKAFNEGQFDAALRALDGAAAENPDAATMEKVQLLRGQCFAVRQDFGHAEEAFALALEANPEAALDPGKVDPAVVKLLESMRARSFGTLTFRTTPPQAHIFVDGADQGEPPLSINTVIGRHRVEARWASDKKAQLEVLVRARRETFVYWVLDERVVEKIVEKIVEKPVEVKMKDTPVVPPLPPDRLVRPYGGIRAGADLNAGPEAGLDIAAGIELKYLAIGLYFRPYRYVYLIPRVAGIWPIYDWLSLFLEAEVPIRPLAGRFGVALGINVGAEVFLKPWLGLFVEAGGKGFFINDSFVVDARVWVGAGVRVRLP
jgi:tetratricopeptide (TPR) repeat protein